MFVRVVEVKTKPEKAREVCSMLHEKVLSTLKASSLRVSGRRKKMPNGTAARTTPKSAR